MSYSGGYVKVETLIRFCGFLHHEAAAIFQYKTGHNSQQRKLSQRKSDAHKGVFARRKAWSLFYGFCRNGAAAIFLRKPAPIPEKATAFIMKGAFARREQGHKYVPKCYRKPK